MIDATNENANENASFVDNFAEVMKMLRDYAQEKGQGIADLDTTFQMAIDALCKMDRDI